MKMQRSEVKTLIILSPKVGYGASERCSFEAFAVPLF